MTAEETNPLLSMPAQDRRDALDELSSESAPLTDSEVNALVGVIESKEVAQKDRELAAVSIGKRLQPETARALSDLCPSDDAGIRELVMLALGHQKSEVACRSLVEALADPINKVRNNAERSLLSQPVELQQLLFPRLRELLEHEEPLTRSPAARLLGEFGDPDALSGLIKMATTDDEWLGRVWATTALGPLGRADAVATLEGRLRTDEKNRVRMAAAEALGVLKPGGAGEILTDALQSEDDERVRKAIEEALSALELVTDGESNPLDDQ